VEPAEGRAAQQLLQRRHALQRRQNAAVALEGYLDATYPTQQVWVVGDRSDDTDTSITVGSPTPWASVLGDPARYTLPTKAPSTGSGARVTHAFASRRTYTVTLATSPAGSRSTASESVVCSRSRCR
jgi:hypothetical protein